MTVTLSPRAHIDIAWWASNFHACSRSMRIQQPSVFLTSDSSDYGWGGTLDSQSTGGQWSATERQEHINYKELLAGLLTLQCFCSDMSSVHVRISMDNSTAVSYIQRKGGKKHKLMRLTNQMWEWAQNRNIWLSACHLPGHLNVTADEESRRQPIDDKEWSLKQSIFDQISQLWGPFDMDFFASRLNFKVSKYVAWRPDPLATAVDAFSINWGNYYGFFFPPFSVLTAVIHKLEQDQARAVLIAPIWPTQPWFSKLLRFLVSPPQVLPSAKDCLISPTHPSLTHPLAPKLKLAAFKVSGIRSEVRDFQTTLSLLSSIPGDRPLKNNMQVTSRDGTHFVLHNKLIVFHPLPLMS